METEKKEVKLEEVNCTMGFIVIADINDADNTFILAIKRKKGDKSYPGAWSFPGNVFKDENESVDLLFQDIKRETNLDETDNISYVGRYSVKYKRRGVNYKVDAFQIVYTFPVNLITTGSDDEIVLLTPDEALDAPFLGKASKGILYQYLKEIGIVKGK